MNSVETIRDNYDALEASLDTAARSLAGSGLEVSREHIGETLLCAQDWKHERDARFDFRDIAESPCVALRFAPDMLPLTVEFRIEGADTFSRHMTWAAFDSLSKLLILEGFAASGATLA